MSQSGDYSVRSLAEILQEHGLETELGTRPNRRRKEGGSKADWPALPAPESQPPSRLRPPPEAAPGTTPPRPAPAEAAAPYAKVLREHGLESEFGTRPGRRPEGRSKAGWPARPAPEDQPPSRLRPRPSPAPPRRRGTRRCARCRPARPFRARRRTPLRGRPRRPRTCRCTDGAAPTHRCPRAWPRGRCRGPADPARRPSRR